MTGIVMPECRHDIYNTLQRAATARTRWHDEAPPITGRSLDAMSYPRKNTRNGISVAFHLAAKRNAFGI